MTTVIVIIADKYDKCVTLWNKGPNKTHSPVFTSLKGRMSLFPLVPGRRPEANQNPAAAVLPCFAGG